MSSSSFLLARGLAASRPPLAGEFASVPLDTVLALPGRALWPPAKAPALP